MYIYIYFHPFVPPLQSHLRPSRISPHVFAAAGAALHCVYIQHYACLPQVAISHFCTLCTDTVHVKLVDFIILSVIS